MLAETNVPHQALRERARTATRSAAYERDGGYEQAKRALGMSATPSSTR
jgi:hypothetical protein